MNEIPKSRPRTEKPPLDFMAGGEIAAAERTETLAPCIYVASLVDCDVGRQHGCWIEARQLNPQIAAPNRKAIFWF
jgi:hypothetical protein